jgi:hypothetical protein
VNTAEYKFQEMKKYHDWRVVLEARERKKTTVIILSVYFKKYTHNKCSNSNSTSTSFTLTSFSRITSTPSAPSTPNVIADLSVTRQVPVEGGQTH